MGPEWWRLELHRQIDDALPDLQGVVGLVVLVEINGGTTRELKIRSTLQGAKLLPEVLERARSVKPQR